MAEALYRKYRPQVFSEVVGQDHIERTLKNALENNKLSHAYLFCGPRGTGKTTTARLLAKALLCERGPTSNPDGTCASCTEIAQGEHPDVYELDAASRTGVENVREEIISRVQFAPTHGAYKVYIIDEVHMLSTAAFNALLKTLEEPPDHVVFILCTTDPQKVPETILSRCQRFDFKRISTQGMADRLQTICEAEGASFEREALELIAGGADGGLRNALTALEQAIAFGEGNVSVACVQQLSTTQTSCEMSPLIEACAKHDIAAAFLWADSYAQAGGSFVRAASDVAQRVRDMYFCAVAGSQAPLACSSKTRACIIEQAQQFSTGRLAYLLDVLGTTMQQLKGASNARLCFEIALTKICRPESEVTLESLAQRIEALEAGVGTRPATTLTPAAEAAQEASTPVETHVPVDTPVPATTPAPAAEATTPAPAAEAQDTSVSASSATATPVTTTPACADAPVTATPALGAVEPSEKLEGLDNPAQVQRVWKHAFAEIKRERPAYTSLLMSAHVSYNRTNNSFDIAFSSSYAFALNMLQKPEALNYLQQVVSHTAGAPVTVSVFVDGEQQHEQPQQCQQQPQQQHEQPQPQQCQQQQHEQQPQQQESDPFAIPETNATPLGIADFQHMLEQSFGEGVVVTEQE